MALTTIHPNEAKPKGSNGKLNNTKPKANLPPQQGHPVRGRGTN